VVGEATGFAHSPWSGGRGGPRVANNVAVNKTTVVNVQNITLYRNASVQKAVVVVNQRQFRCGHVTGARIRQVDVRNLQPSYATPPVTATPARFVPTASHGIRPP
jgi:hypothetical protein